MKRRALAAVSSVSLVLLLVAAASWIRSYRVYDELAFGAFGHGRWAWTSYSSSHPFAKWPPAAPTGASLTLLTCYGKLYLHETVHHADTERRGAARGYAWASDDDIIPSFSYLHAVTGDMSGNGWWTIRQVTMRHWALLALFAIAPAVWLRSSRRRDERTP